MLLALLMRVDVTQARVVVAWSGRELEGERNAIRRVVSPYATVVVDERDVGSGTAGGRITFVVRRLFSPLIGVLSGDVCGHEC